jgi:hypothetical protein
LLVVVDDTLSSSTTTPTVDLYLITAPFNGLIGISTCSLISRVNFGFNIVLTLDGPHGNDSTFIPFPAYNCTDGNADTPNTDFTKSLFHFECGTSAHIIGNNNSLLLLLFDDDDDDVVVVEILWTPPSPRANA